MSLKVQYSRNYQLVKTGFGVWCGYSPSPDDCYNHTVQALDLLLPILGTLKFYVPGGPRPLHAFCGLTTDLGELETFTISNRPRSLRVISNSYDSDYYGSFFRNLQVFGSVLSGASFSPPSAINENYGRHATYSGSTSLRQTDVSHSIVDYNFYGYTVKVDKLATNSMFTFATINSLLPLDATISSQCCYGDQWTYNLIDLLDFIKSNIVDVVGFVGPHLFRRTITSLTYDYTDDYLLIKYGTDTTRSDGVVVNWDSSIRIPLGNPPRTISPYVGLTVNTTLNTRPITFSYRLTGSKLDAGNPCLTSGPDTSDEFSSEPYSSYPIFISTPGPTDSAVIEKLSKGYAQLRNNVFLEPFRRSVESAWVDVVPSSLFSSVDAFKKAEGYLGVNVLQNLAKIPDIVSALPKIREALDVLGRLVRRDLSLSTIREILDLATSTNLQANFQWRPFLALITEYLPRMLATFDSLGLPTSVVKSYGQFRFKFAPGEFGRDSVTLVTRTKIVMDSSPSGLLSAALNFDALGLLPKASNLWDLLPFTFVVNWFTGIGEAIRRAEYTLLLATIPAYFVHSYTFESPLRDSELESLGMSSTGPHIASLRLYYRDKTLFNPVVRDSRFGFGIPTQLPSLGVMGSLLYQLIFG